MDSMLEVNNVPYRNGKKRLVIQTAINLDDLLNHADCPIFLHSTLYGKTTWQKRNEFSLGHVLGVPSLAPQFVGALLAWGAYTTLDDGNEQPLESTLTVSDGHNRIRSLLLPLEIPGRVWAEARTGSTPTDWPIVWAMAVIDLHDDQVQDARLALSGVWKPGVALAKSAGLLRNQPLTETSIQQTTEAVTAEVTPRADFRGSVEYRKAMAGVMTRRALQACLEGVPA